ncbi:MAG: CopG family transcriptional regulator [Candidatus Dormibacteraeota bacterium]|nr:CopG family transcriptional regulator [Candidatus Dormibacteraeota bacterium]
MRTRSGKVLTDRDVEDLAREAEAGYDLAQAKRRKVGRPSLSVGTSPRVQFRIEPDVFEKAKKKAASESRSLSDVGRALFDDYVAPRKAHGKRAGPRRRAGS